MVSKTRRKTQKRHSSTRKRRGGAINKLRNIPAGMTLNEFEDKYDVYYISAHGGLLGEKFVVPEMTYLMHSVPSTYTCRLAGDDENLDRFYRPRANENEGYNDENFMAFIQNPRTLFGTIYRSNNELLRDLFVSPNNTRYQNLKYQSEITSIYEPGDEVRDVILQFYSYYVEATAEGGTSHFIAPGIFKIPMSSQTKRTRDALLADIRRLGPRAPRNVVGKTLKAADREFTNLPGNILGQIVNRTKRNTFRLSELLDFRELEAGTSSTGEPKKRLFIIHACKSMSGSANNDRRRVRSESVNRIKVTKIRNANLPSQFNRARRQLNAMQRSEQAELNAMQQFELAQLTRGERPRGIISGNTMTWNNVERISRIQSDI
jgi:hypothetical protein